MKLFHKVLLTLSTTALVFNPMISTPSISAQESNNSGIHKNFITILREVDKDNCKGTTEVNYRSQQIQSPDGNTTAYFEGVLRRIGGRDNFLRGSYCVGGSGSIQTPVRNLVVQKNNIRKFGKRTFNNLYLVSYPISFSKDSRYLVVEDRIDYEGDVEIGVVIFDLQNNSKEISIKPCRTTNRERSKGVTTTPEFRGFNTKDEAVFFCSNRGYGPGTDEWFESINLSRQTARRISSNSVGNLQTYGKITSSTSVTKRQVFPRK